MNLCECGCGIEVINRFKWGHNFRVGRNKPISGIYALINTINGQIYIGSSSDIMHRWSYHKRYMERGTHEQKKLREAALEFGVSAFLISVLEECNERELLKHREQFWLDTSLPELNTATSAFDTRGVLPTEEQNRKKSEAMKGKTNEGSRLAHLGNSYRKGKRDSDETRLLKSIAAKKMWERIHASR